MREILFKAKRLDNGEWVEGVPVDITPLICFSGDVLEPEVIMVRGWFADWGMPRKIEGTKVDPETICRFTGLIGKNRENVFENDLVKLRTGRVCKVMFRNTPEYCGFDLVPYSEIDKPAPKFAVYNDLEVIGNIHDEVKS